MKEKRKYLYVLECEGDNYYIGQTNDITRRFRQHMEQGKEGAVWTSNHKPKRIVEYWNIEEYAQEDAVNFENRLTIEYINKYGWENVRGGIYIFLDKEHHLGLLNLYNNCENGIFKPIATAEKIEAFISIKNQLLNYPIKRGIAYIYVLELKDSKVFVGRSSNLLKDIRKLLYSKKRHWTTLHPPIGILEIQEDKDLGTNHPCHFRNSIVKRYMEKYGWENVRGGDYVSIATSRLKPQILKKLPHLI